MFMLQSLAVALFVCSHLFAGRLRFLDGLPRSRWLSFAGGISVAYVFLHIFPELEAAQANLADVWPVAGWLEHHAYLVALIGLTIFYALERMIRRAGASAGVSGQNEPGSPAGKGVFWLHIVSFALYNGLIGYLLVHREEQDLRGLVFYAVAMTLHFLVNDYGLRRDHKVAYRRTGRWILAAAILAGWLLGLATQISMAAVGLLFALLAGGVILNVLKEELPQERQSRLLPFVLGVFGYAALLSL